MRTPIIAGNWKMYKTVAEGRELVAGLLAGLGEAADREVVVCPPYTALYAIGEQVAGTSISLGAQEVFYEAQGAYTGAVAPQMLSDVGCRYAIVGHSERRQFFGDTDATVNRKLRAALANGLRPIMCVGESKPQRDSGQAESIVTAQVRAGLVDVSAEQMADVVIAYEPIWAIGTGDTATSADAQAMHAAIRATLAEIFGDEVAQTVRIQYGGSVKPDNVDELMAQPDIDGALVGGASL
ncbi:MAG: triose-phosphate isomerase, partial [Oscillochloris sp.]|nr:triose-phosphate isomerase [Oscillochloris sp.]